MSSVVTVCVSDIILKVDGPMHSSFSSFTLVLLQEGNHLHEVRCCLRQPTFRLSF